MSAKKIKKDNMGLILDTLSPMSYDPTTISDWIGNLMSTLLIHPALLGWSVLNWLNDELCLEAAQI
jgi:hypothetical protein